ncbi:ABC transporter substrate-binding protein [Bifidobacterium sp. ESL0800]|uniref:ABC transporter substrate-binding protein n=1 Tax=Bifidobacterium sp. ESL0800 TaxID=2983236 RepID=UPI0023F91291|nr:ABC transporter substrate-binding protein [Bifidobacterium sp. ESL0800]WEV75900.1 ABC transporter substrate-binding protein [Bifidobacterium sp. ESL0800]
MPTNPGAYGENDATDKNVTGNDTNRTAANALDGSVHAVGDSVNVAGGSAHAGGSGVNAEACDNSSVKVNANNAASTDETLNAHVKGAAGGIGGNSSGGNGRGKGWIWAIVAAVIVVALIVAFAVIRNRKADTGVAEIHKAETVTIGLKLAPTNLDIRNQSGSALDQVLVGNVYEGLVARDSKNKVIPGLAKSWEKNADGTSYTFHLNKGMAFSNGDKLDADDVAWSINELVAKHYHDSESLMNFKSVTAVDADTVRLDLSAPNAELLWELACRPGLVFDRDAHYDMKTQAVGSGPYTVAKFVPNDSITLKANPKYWGSHKAKTPSVVLRYLNDDNAAVNALKSGDVDVLAPVTENLAEPFEKDAAHYSVAAGDDTDKYVLAMNSKGEKTSDVRVRQAIRYAIDHQQLIASRGGADKPLGGPIPSLDPGYEDLTGLYPHNVGKAKALMKQAGYSPDHPLTLRLTYANTYGTELGDQLRSQLKPIGIDLKVNVVEFSTWLQDVLKNKDYDLSLVDHNESHDFAQWVNDAYYYNYSNQKVKDYYNQAMAASSDSQRDALLARAARVVSVDAPADWLFNYRITTAMKKGVHGFPLNLNQTLLPLYGVTYTAEGK